MASIKSKNASPEMIIRRGMHHLGYRYRPHNERFTGKPDLFFARHYAVIFINGYFWPGYHCHIFHWPIMRPEFWQNKT